MPARSLMISTRRGPASGSTLVPRALWRGQTDKLTKKCHLRRQCGRVCSALLLLSELANNSYFTRNVPSLARPPGLSVGVSSRGRQ